MPYQIGLSLISPHNQKALSAEARRILSEFEERPIAEADIVREEQGRPYFSDRHADFSISHSGAMAAVSCAGGPMQESSASIMRTGCDIERIRPRTNAGQLAELFFCPHERDYVFSKGEFDLTRFYRIWTLKESYLKCKGLTVFDMKKAPSFISGKPGPELFAFDTAVSVPLSFYLYELRGNDNEHYILASVLEGLNQEPPIIQWFSEVSLSLKSRAEIKAPLSPADTVRPKM